MMGRTFEVGKEYFPYAPEFEPITVKRRTEKTIWVDNCQVEWSMRIKRDKDGNEFAVDSSVPRNWRDAFTYFA